MPFVTVSLRRPKTTAFKDAVLAGVHQALVGIGVPPTDRFHRVLELAPEDLRFDPSYPDLTKPRSENFVLIEILMGVGRSVKLKRQVAEQIVASLRRDPGIDPEDVMIVFNETRWENWSFGGGRLLHG
jgi:phenylpyruvate tautomerase PptA (4-oxalocrotonate tautomerase family)